MLSRHFLRAKVLQFVYAYKTGGIVDVDSASQQFSYHVKHLNDLAAFQLGTFRSMVTVMEKVLDRGKAKLKPTYEELHPNYRMVQNEFLQRLFQNFSYRQAVDHAVFPWEEHYDVFYSAFNELRKWEKYQDYMNLKQVDFDTDKQMALDLFRFMMNNDNIRGLFIERSLLWEDDFDQIAQYVFMQLKDLLGSDFDEATVLPLMIDERQEIDMAGFNFGRSLLINTLRDYDDHEPLIRKYLRNWDYERVSLVDLIILNMSITEFERMATVPTRVTVDEAIELSKDFSSNKSRIFVNGILDKLLSEMRSMGKVVKSGRGLDETCPVVGINDYVEGMGVYSSGKGEAGEKIN